MTEFAQEINDKDDPFEGSDFDFSGEEHADTADLPVVDREGRRVEPQHEEGLPGGQTSPLQQPREDVSAPAPAHTPPPGPSDPAAEAAEYRESRGEPDPTPAETGGATGSTTEDPAPVDPTPAIPEALEHEALAHVADSPPTESAPTPSAAPVSTEESSTPPAESAGLTETATQEPAPDAAEADAPAPTPTSKKRSYLLFQPDGPGKFSQVFWYEDKAGKMVTRGTPGARRQGVALARGTEDALHTGYAAVGSPPPGCKLVAVASANFQVKDVKPKPPEPGKQRLQIS